MQHATNTENSHSQTSFYRGHSLHFVVLKAAARQKQIRKYTSTLVKIQSAFTNTPYWEELGEME
jgi:hypothetical protein